MKRHIVCFGDSNTFGYCADPKDCADSGGRFNEDERWPCLLQAGLGNDCLVIEEGLCGRTTVFDDPFSECRSAMDYVIPCLNSHAPVDLLIIMLGTNDVKERFASTPACIGMGMSRLVSTAIRNCGWGAKGVNVLVIAPPHIREDIYQTSHANTMAQAVWKNPGSWLITINCTTGSPVSIIWMPRSFTASLIKSIICT